MLSTGARSPVLALLVAATMLSACGQPSNLASAGSPTGAPSSTPASAPNAGALAPAADYPLFPPPSPAPSPSGASSPPGTGETSYVVAAPAPFDGRLNRGDVLITAKTALPRELAVAMRAVPGVTKVLRLGVASASVDGRTLAVASVDPDGLRSFTPAVTAQAGFVWTRLAQGEAVVDEAVSRRLIDDGDRIGLGTRSDAPSLHVGAYAPLTPGLQVLVNRKRGKQLSMRPDNALLVSTGSFTPSALEQPMNAALRRVLGPRARNVSVESLALEFRIGASRTAILTGGSVSDAVGQFTYTNLPLGQIAPDPAWVEDYIRVEAVPILGEVTCNKAVLPQLRAALEEVVAAGLSSAINPAEYAGCYYPRYIGRDPANGLSLHSWGIALDLNTPGNQRGTVGEMDRRVVAIFKKWGFAWGGDWNYTDPMHFEMNAVVEPEAYSRP